MFRRWWLILHRLCSDQGEEWGRLLFRGGGFLEKGCLYFLITKTIYIHKKMGKLAALTGGCPQVDLDLLKYKITLLFLSWKNLSAMGWVNSSIFVLEPKVLDYVDGDSTVLKKEPLNRLVADNEVAVNKHEEFWQGIDAPRDKNMIQKMWDFVNAPWKVW